MAKGKYPVALIPYTTLTPPACEALAAAIEDALDVFDQWGLRTGMGTRLAKAKSHLRAVAASGSYGETPDELILTARAVRLAHDFYLISRTLKTDRAEPIATELESALQGPFLARESKRVSAVDFQSQFWVGVMLAYSGLHPKMPAKEGRKPDFVISVGSLDCGVEVKRPESARSAFAAVSSAASQLRDYGLPGVITLDLSACVGADGFILAEDAAAALEVMRGRFYPMARQLRDEMDAYSSSDKFKRVLLLISFARYFIWTPGGTTDENNGYFISFQAFPDSCEKLIVDVPDRITKLFIGGLRRATGNSLKIHRR